MANKIIGMEIGHDTLKVAVVSGGKVTDMAVERMPEGMMREGYITAPSAMSQFIRSLLSAHKLGKGKCALVLPREAVITRQITVPVMGEAELKLNLPYEFRDFVGRDGGKYDYDYAVVSNDGKLLNLFAAAIRSDIVEQYADVLSKAGLKLKAAMPIEMAWVNLLRRCTTEPKQLCIVDVGATTTRVNIFKDNAFVMGKDIPIAGSTMDETIAKAQGVEPFVARAYKESADPSTEALPDCSGVYGELSVEVMRIINFYFSSNREGSAMQDVYFAGGGSMVEPLRTAIVKRTDFTPHHIKRLITGDVSSDDAMFCTLAAGAAMQLQ